MRGLIALLLFSALSLNSHATWLQQACPVCDQQPEHLTGLLLLERGEDALLARAWLARHATQRIDIQYFIWSTDNIGILASTELLAAAKRGVKIRVLVDDFLIDAENDTLLALAAQENVEIRIYNPSINIGVPAFRQALNLLTRFRAVNQRMHDKTAIFDNAVGITGGRNMADEYFDFDHQYNFRDRDVLLIGNAVEAMSENFEEFWTSPLSIPVTELLAEQLSQLPEEKVTAHHAMLEAYASDPQNFAPEVRQALEHLPHYFPALIEQLVWDEAYFISDVPGKNTNSFSLGGGGQSTQQLITLLANAKQSILIQSPYLILPEGGVELLESLVDRGVRVRISTNSLSSTDNLLAFSGYYRQRRALLAAGVEIFEFKPDAQIRQELNQRSGNSDAVFALHAKSMVIDGSIVYIGTFNLDPRSANLNTEVGVLVNNAALGKQLAASIEADIRPENSWQISSSFNPDAEQAWYRRLWVWLLSWLPLQAVL